MQRSWTTGSHTGKGAQNNGQILERKDHSDEVTEYSQPDFSSYRCEDGLVKLQFGKRKESYSVPTCLVKKVQELATRLKPMADPIIWLEEIDEDIGHTIVHYLYTGEYQTLRQSGTAHKRQTEYKRSVLVYCAAANLEIPHLQRIAAGHMERFANSVDIYQTLNLVKTLFSSVPWWDGGLYFHIIKRLRNAFRADPTIFERREFLGCLGGDLELDKLMVQIMVSLWEPSKSKPWNHVQSVPENSLREGFPAMERCFELCSISRAPTPIGSEPYVKPDPVGLSPVLGVDYFGQPSTGGEILKRRGSFSENPRKRIRNKFSGNL